MAPSERERRFAASVRAALPALKMPSPARERWRERLVRAAEIEMLEPAERPTRGRHSWRAAGTRWWQWATAAVVIVALAGVTSYGTFLRLCDEAVARAWEERVLARTEQLLQHPELWREDPNTLAQRLGAGHAHVVHPSALTPVSRTEVRVPLGPSEVLVLEPSDDVERLAGGMRRVFWTSVGAGLVPLLAGGGWLWVRWRRTQRMAEEVGPGD